MSTVRALILKARVRLWWATTDSEAHHPVLSYTHDRTSRDAVGGKDDKLYQINVDNGEFAYSGNMALTAEYHQSVLASKDNG